MVTKILKIIDAISEYSGRVTSYLSICLVLGLCWEIYEGRIPLHFFKDESIQKFQKSMKDMFIGEGDRSLKKRYFQLFIEKIVINLPRVEIVAKPEVILAVLENKKAVKTDGVLTAVGAWLPSTDSNRGPGG